MKQQRFVLRPGETAPLANLLTWIASRDPEKTWSVEVAEFKRNRKKAQNAYLWAAVYPTIQQAIRDSRGEFYSTEEIHEWFRDKFLPNRVVTIKGESKAIRPSTTSLSPGEFWDYVDQIICFCAESGIVIPEPERRDEPAETA